MRNCSCFASYHLVCHGSATALHQVSEATYNQVYSTREKPSFSDTQKDTANHETSKVVNETGKRHDQAPAHDENSEVSAGTFEFLEDDIRRNLKQDVRNEENTKGDVVLPTVSISGGVNEKADMALT